MTEPTLKAFPPSLGVKYGLRLADAAKHAHATLVAIDLADLLSSTSADADNMERHNTALYLLEGVRSNLGRVLADESGEAALSFMSGTYPDAFDAAVTHLAAIDDRLKVARTEEEVDPLADAESKAVYDLISTPARTLADVRLKLDRHLRLGWTGDDRNADAFASITRDLERLDCAA